MSLPLLEVRNLHKRFGGLVAVNQSSFSVRAGEIFGIIGPNGAGKTTLFNVIAGHHRPSSGSVLFEGNVISGMTSDRVARHGIARTFQAIHHFKHVTVRENLRRVGVLSRRHGPLAYLSAKRRHEAVSPEEVAAFVGLTGVLDNNAGSLAYGLQKALGIGMALMVAPKLMLMDEPAAGLNSTEKVAAGLLIRRLRAERGISVLLVEHDMPLVMGICDRILVINQGRPIALGTPTEVRSNRAVVDAYLGEDYEFA